MQDANAILPGAKLGILGSGQLGRMFAQAASRMGYRVHVFSSQLESPTGQVAAEQTIADYENETALQQFATAVDVVTLEFENVPTFAVEKLEPLVPVRPSSRVLHVVQNRSREKQFLRDAGIDCAPFANITTEKQLEAAINQIGVPAVLKTAASGYDGKGQIKIDAPEEAAAAWSKLGHAPSVLEAWIEYERELSVIVARSPTSEVAIHGPIANDHANHILDISLFPLPELDSVKEKAHEIGRAIVQAFDLIGVCCIEFFLTTDGKLLVNEIAPRPHNSGHLTIEASTTSQFEQQVRAICGLPLGSVDALHPAAMVNLLGDLWQKGEPRWVEVLSEPGLHLHLYGKAEARVGRKMGHLTVLDETAELAGERALTARKRLSEN